MNNCQRLNETLGNCRNKIFKAEFSAGWVPVLDAEGRTIWIVDAHRGGKRFVVRVDEKLTAFLDSNAPFRVY